MWWSRRAVLAACAFVAGCGFTPLYGPGAPATRMAGKVEVGVIDGAPGFALRERLTGRLGAPTAATHRLDVDLEITRSGVALTQENVTTRFDVVGTAGYALVPLAGGPPVASGVVRSITGYSAPESPGASAFAAQAALEDAERRVAAMLADGIVQRLALSAGDWT
jgi:LPS-assembly lipoprotein